MSRDGEDHMEIMNIQQVFSLLCNPLLFGEGLAFGAVAVTAGIVGYPLVAAVIADIHMSAKRRGAAADNAPCSLPLYRRQLMLRMVFVKMRGKDILYLNGHNCKTGRQDW